MKSMFFIVFVLLIAAPLYAQKPVVQDSIPQLQEWWRADDMQYGINGMTWLDNFYNGKGALVVWTPEGVKTWQLRFPGDTQNVFTWQKGSANIKTGDFNGDGIMDYIDDGGNIYEGIKNGQPPKEEAHSNIGVANIVADINGDGYDDILAFYGIGNQFGDVARVCFGASKIDSMKCGVVSRNSPLDTSNATMNMYTISNGKIRFLFRHYKRNLYDGYRLYEITMKNSTDIAKIVKLDEYYPSTGKAIFRSTNTIYQYGGKTYWLTLEMIDEKFEQTNLTIYDLSNDKIEKVKSIRMDKVSTGGISIFFHGIDMNSIPSLCIRQYNEFAEPVLHIYNGNISDNLREIAQYTTVQVASVISLSDVTGDGRPDIALSNDYFPSFEKYKFCVLSLKDSTTSVNEVKSNVLLPSIKVISPFPVSNNQTVKLKVSVPQAYNYTLTLFDNSGKKITGKTQNYQLSGEQILMVNIEDYKVGSGIYTFSLEGQGKVAQCTIIIQ